MLGWKDGFKRMYVKKNGNAVTDVQGRMGYEEWRMQHVNFVFDCVVCKDILCLYILIMLARRSCVIFSVDDL